MAKAKKWRYTGICNSRRDNEYYEVLYCSNCRRDIDVFIKKGTTIKEVEPEIKCENCGVLNQGQEG